MNIQLVLPFTLFALHFSPALAASDDEVVKLMVGLVPGTMIQFCTASVPELRPQLDATAKSFEAKILKATTLLLERLRTEGQIGADPQKEELDEIRQRILVTLTNVDAPKYCAALIKKLESADAEAMAEATLIQFRKLSAANEQSRQQTK